MRIGIAAATALLLALGVMLAPHEVQAAGPKDYAKGAGTQNEGIVGEEQKFSFNAWSDPANNDPQGWLKVEYRGVTFSATVTCLAVRGQDATIWGDITRIKGGTPIFPTHDGLVIVVTDSGDPTIPDSFHFQTAPESVRAGDCVAAPGLFPLQQGDVTVIDE